MIIILLCLHRTVCASTTPEGSCETDDDCLDPFWNATHKICASNGSCIIRPLHLDDECKHDNHCIEIDSHSVCKNLTCDCAPNFVRSDMGHCVSDEDKGSRGLVITLGSIIGVAVLAGLISLFVYTRKNKSPVKEEPEAVMSPQVVAVTTNAGNASNGPVAGSKRRSSSKAIRPAPPIPPDVHAYERISYTSSTRSSIPVMEMDNLSAN